MSSKFVALAAVALIGVGSVASARADVLFDNTGQAIAGGDPIISYAVNSSGAGPIAASFSTGVQGVDLSSVTVALEAPSPLDGGSVTVTLWSDSSGSGPLSQIAVAKSSILDSSLSSSSFNLISTSFAAGVVLASNTRYWVELASSDSSALWGYDSSSAGTNVQNEYTWNNYPGQPPLTANTDGYGSYVMQVNAVPEPASLLLVGFGLVALAAARRRRGVV